MILFGRNKKHSWENLIFVCVCIYKWLILPKKYLKTMILMKMKTEVVIDGVNTLWINEKHVEEQLGHKNIPAITNKYDKIYKKYRYELVDDPIKQPNRRFLRIDLEL